MEVMFYIIAGKFNPSNDDFPVKTLITKDKFADKYAQDCTNLLDQQDIFKIIDFCPRYDVCRDAAKVIAAGYDCVEVTSRMYLNVTLDTKLECTTQYYADELGKLLMAIKNDIEDVVNYIETQYHISIEYAVDIA